MTTDQTTHRPAGRLSRGRDELHLALDALAQSNEAVLSQMVGLQSVANALNQMVKIQPKRVLWSGTAVIKADGHWSTNQGVGSKAIFVANPTGNGPLTVVAGPNQGSPPGPGVGVHQLAAGTFAIFNGITTDWTLYGTPGQSVEVQVFSVPLTPNAGAL